MARKKTVTQAEMVLTARDRTQAVLSRVQRGMRQLQRAAVAVGKAVGVAFAAATAAIMRMTQVGLRNVDALAKQADMVGMSTEALAGFQRQATRAGMTVDGFNRNIERMSVALAQAEQGLGTAGRGLEAIGLKIEDVAGLSADEQMMVLARAMENVESQAVRTAAAYDIFGQRGVRMLRILEQGEDAMRRANQRAIDLGITVSRFDAARVEAANDAWDEMGQLVGALQNQLAIQFAHIITELSNRVVSLVEDFGGMGPVAERVFNFVVQSAGMAGNAFRRLQILIKTGEIGMLGLADAAVKAGNFIISSFTDALDSVGERFNQWIDRYNMLARVNPLAPVIPRLEQMGDKLEIVGDGIETAIGQAIGELRELEQMEMPADRISRFFDVVLEKSNAAAAEAIKVSDTMGLVAEGTERSLGRAGEFVVRFADRLEDALVNAAMQGKFAIGDLARFVLAEINRMFIRMMILRPLFGSLGNVFGGSLGEGFTQAADNFGGARANGGSVQGGQMHLVGERGPELFVPRSGGHVVPNHQLGGGSQSQNVYIDARGRSSEEFAEIRQQVQALNASFDARAAVVVQQQFQRRPAFGMR